MFNTLPSESTKTNFHLIVKTHKHILQDYRLLANNQEVLREKG